ncbi:homogentisate phytyltransferase [Leptolyngbya cf. ectocarpi LEGE 11479]|uniref:Homogentisate phytyltransferase n=1 Tax=Leptolyngbya cf. ectocarpi LEGE 11479 TaxID=1828722 RepID=A0A928X0W5_LEPEC|nr:homogentisate phytyltransferase [Leptolyngbya ectocarpi]MBE9067050.1 homogentisate phytyltransferase [Leptolyngbya cf. ectocarpi LEGE 11479]
MVSNVNKSQHPNGPFSWGRWLRSFWAFSRPHTIVGTTLSVGALGVMALVLADLGTGAQILPLVWVMLAALVPSLCANVYIVGLNQLTDIAIDRINKPHLPLASGAFSLNMGRWIVWVLGGLALLLSAVQGPILLATVGLSMAIGTVYSLPPLRLKRFPFWAALCIFGVRGVIVNLGFFAHFRRWLTLRAGLESRALSIPPEVWALTMFVVVFAFAIAIFKDIPDLEGDRQFQVRTLTVRLGPRFVFRLALGVLTLCYGLLIGLALFGVLPSVQSGFLAVTHSLLLGLLWWQSRRVSLQDKSEISGFYQFIWRLFFLEYLLFPLACVLGQ